MGKTTLNYLEIPTLDGGVEILDMRDFVSNEAHKAAMKSVEENISTIKESSKKSISDLKDTIENIDIESEILKYEESKYDYFYVEPHNPNSGCAIRLYDNTYLGERRDLIEYSFDKKNWHHLPNGEIGFGSRIYLRCVGETLVKHFMGNIAQRRLLDFTAHYFEINIGGNLDMLMFNYKKVVKGDYEQDTSSCWALFNNLCVVDASNLILPSMVLKDSCYSEMFYGCTTLIAAPKLPATTLANYCYGSMFKGCTSLEVAPELHAATSDALAYSEMFYGCSKLSYIKCLDTDSLYRHMWTEGVSPTGTFVKSSSATNWETSINGIPEGWNVEDYMSTEEKCTNLENRIIELENIVKGLSQN